MRPAQRRLVQVAQAHVGEVARVLARCGVQSDHPLRIDEPGLDEVDQVHIGQSGRGEERGHRSQRGRQYARCHPVALLQRGAGRTGDHRRLLGVQAQLLGGVDGAVGPQHLGPVRTELAEEGPDRVHRPVVGQAERVHRGAQLVVGRLVQVSRGHRELRRPDPGRVVLHRRLAQRLRLDGGAVQRDIGFQHLVDEVDVGQRGVGVGAGQLQVLQIRAAAQQLVDRRYARRGWQRRGQVVQQVHQVGGRAQHRLAGVAVAEAGRPEERGPVRQLLGERTGVGAFDGGRGDPVDSLMQQGEQRRHRRRGRLRLGVGRHRLGRAAQQPAEALDELVPRHPGDLLRAVQPVREKAMRGKGVRRQPPDPFEPAQLSGHGRAVLLGYRVEGGLVGGQVGVDGSRSEGEPGLVAQERGHPGPDRVGEVRTPDRAGVGAQFCSQGEKLRSRGGTGQGVQPAEVGRLHRGVPRVVPGARRDHPFEQPQVELRPTGEIGRHGRTGERRPDRRPHPLRVRVGPLLVPVAGQPRRQVLDLPAAGAPDQVQPPDPVPCREVPDRTLAPQRVHERRVVEGERGQLQRLLELGHHRRLEALVGGQAGPELRRTPALAEPGQQLDVQCRIDAGPGEYPPHPEARARCTARLHRRCVRGQVGSGEYGRGEPGHRPVDQGGGLGRVAGRDGPLLGRCPQPAGQPGAPLPKQRGRVEAHTVAGQPVEDLDRYAGPRGQPPRAGQRPDPGLVGVGRAGERGDLGIGQRGRIDRAEHGEHVFELGPPRPADRQHHVDPGHPRHRAGRSDLDLGRAGPDGQPRRCLDASPVAQRVPPGRVGLPPGQFLLGPGRMPAEQPDRRARYRRAVRTGHRPEDRGRTRPVELRLDQPRQVGVDRADRTGRVQPLAQRGQRPGGTGTEPRRLDLIRRYLHPEHRKFAVQ